MVAVVGVVMLVAEEVVVVVVGMDVIRWFWQDACPMVSRCPQSGKVYV